MKSDLVDAAQGLCDELGKTSRLLRDGAPCWVDALVDLEACPEAVDWAVTQIDAEAAWAACQRADWMLWLAGHCCKRGDLLHLASLNALVDILELVIPTINSKSIRERLLKFAAEVRHLDVPQDESRIKMADGLIAEAKRIASDLAPDLAFPVKWTDWKALWEWMGVEVPWADLVRARVPVVPKFPG